MPWARVTRWNVIPASGESLPTVTTLHYSSGRAANRWGACQGGEDKRRIPAHTRTSRNTVAHMN